MLGRLLAERGVRDGVVLATTYGFAAGGGPVSGGSGRANMTRAGEGSLRRLGTDRIDVYWMHLWDGFTPADKVLHGMVDLVRAGKIRHYGFSNMPAWFVVEAATLARAHGIPGPAALQLEYSLVSRDIEREHVRAAQEMGLGMVPWSPLAGGFLSGQSHREEQRTPNSGRLSGANPFGDSRSSPSAPGTSSRRSATSPLHSTGHLPRSHRHGCWVDQRSTLCSSAPAPRTNLGRLWPPFRQDFRTTHRRRLDAIGAPDLGYPHAIITDPMIESLVGGGTHVRRHHAH